MQTQNFLSLDMLKLLDKSGMLKGDHVIPLPLSQAVPNQSMICLSCGRGEFMALVLGPW